MMWRKPDSPPAEDRFEEWFNRKRQESVLEGQVEAPQGPHPDDSFLRDLARKSRSINLSDPRVDHAASCPLCMRKLLAMRNEKATTTRRVALTAAIACCVLVVATIVWISGRRSTRGSANSKRRRCFKDSGFVQCRLLSRRSACPVAICFLADCPRKGDGCPPALQHSWTIRRGRDS